MKVPNDNPESGTYTVYDPLTRISSSGRTFENLFDNVARTRYALGVSSGLDLRKEVEAWVCRDYPGDCTGIDLTKPRKRRLTLSDVINGSRVMMSFVKSGREVVDRAEAERRAQICKTCPFNIIFPKPCAGVCGELLNIVKVITGNQGTQYDGSLHSCSVCGCFLQAAIWLPLETQCQGVPPEMAKQFTAIPNCWKAGCASPVDNQPITS